MQKNTNLKAYSLKEMEHYKIHGRTDASLYPLPLFFNGSAVEVNATGSELWIDVEAEFDVHEPWIWTTLNGSFISRQMLLPGSQSLCLFRGMSPDTAKNVKFIRETQPMPDNEACHILVKGFWSDGSFLPVPDKKLRLEFIGDSITSGEGTYGAREDTDWLPMYMGCSRNYAEMTCEALNAEYRLFSQGGWGVLCGWDNDPRHNIPSRYEKLCGLAGGEAGKRLGADRPYDFKGWQPDAVIVNLGTNDASAFNEPAWRDLESGEVFKQRRNPDGSFHPQDLMRFEKAASDFLAMLRKNNPASHIVWAYGMLGYDLTLAITDAVNSYRRNSGDSNVAFLQLPDTTQETLGSHVHPGIRSHRRSAAVLTEYLRKRLDL